MLFLPLITLALGGPAQQPVPAAQDPSSEPVAQREAGLSEGSKGLMALEERMVDSLFERRPWIARERGVRWEEPTLGRFGPTADGWWLDTLDGYRLELGRVELSSLSQEERLEVEWLQAWTEAEITLAFAVASERWNPVTYIERADSVLRSLAEPDTKDVQRRGQAMLRVLDQLSELWASALRGLVAPVEIVSRDASARLVDLTGFMRLKLLEPFDDELDEETRERLQERLKRALIEAESFRQWLDATRARIAEVPPTMGPEGWTKVHSLYAGEDLELLEIKEQALRGLFQLDRRAAPLRALEPTRTKLEERTLRSEVATAWRSAAAFCQRAGLAHVYGPRVKFEARTSKSFFVPGLLGVLRKGFGGGYKLDVELPGGHWTPEMRLTRQRLLEPDGVRVLAVRHGHPGEAWLRERTFQSPSRAVRFLWNRMDVEGWGLFIAHALGELEVDKNPYAGPQFQAHLARQLELEAARLLAALEVHAERRSLDEAINAFQRRTGFDRMTADHEVRGVLHDPMRGCGYLGYLRFVQLDERLRAKLEIDRREALERVSTQMIELPFAPTAVLEGRILSDRKR